MNCNPASAYFKYSKFFLAVSMLLVFFSACKQTSFIMAFKYKNKSIMVYATDNKMKLRIHEECKKKIADSLGHTSVKPKENIHITMQYTRQQERAHSLCAFC